MNESTPKVDIVYAILCDDVRKEVSGKDILIGVYAGSLQVSRFPSGVVLCLWLQLETSGHGDVKLEIRVLNSMGKKITGGAISAGIEDTGDKQGSLALSGMPLKFEKAGSIKIQWRIPGSRWKTVLTKQVILQKS